MDFTKVVHRTIAKLLAKDHRHFKLELRYKGGGGSHVVDNFIDEKFECRSFDGTAWIDEFQISINDIYDYEIFATYEFEPNYFYTPSKTRSLIKIYALFFTRYPFVINKIYMLFCEKLYFLHLNKNASAVQRNKLLEFLVKKCADSGIVSFNIDGIFREFYKKYDKDDNTHINIFSLYIDSLCESEDIVKDNDKIILRGKSINAIDKFNSQKTYQRISVVMQVLMMVATVAIAIFTYKN